MDYRKLKISNVIIVNEKVVLSTNFLAQEENNSIINISIDFFKNLWEDKKLLVVGDNYSLETSFNDLQFTVSFLGNKYIHFLTNLTEIGDIKTNDLIMIIDE